MKKILVVLAVLFVFLVKVAPVMAGGGATMPVKASNDELSFGTISTNATGAPYATDNSDSWYCDSGSEMLLVENIRYSFYTPISVPSLTRYNAGSVSVSDFNSGEMLNNYLEKPNLTAKEVNVVFAGQECWHQVVGGECDGYKCYCASVNPDPTCSDVFYYDTAGKSVIVAVTPYRNLK